MADRKVVATFVGRSIVTAFDLGGRIGLLIAEDSGHIRLEYQGRSLSDAELRRVEHALRVVSGMRELELAEGFGGCA
jgi:hypothetical protein